MMGGGFSGKENSQFHRNYTKKSFSIGSPNNFFSCVISEWHPDKTERVDSGKLSIVLNLDKLLLRSSAAMTPLKESSSEVKVPVLSNAHILTLPFYM